MPQLDMEPGQNPERAGRLLFGTAADPEAFVVHSDGSVAVTSAGGETTIDGQSVTIDSSGTAINAVDRGAPSNFAAYVMRTAGADRWSVQMINDATHDLVVSDSANGTVVLRAEARATAPNLSLLTSVKSYGGGAGVVFIPNASAVPGSNPAGGGILYVEAGALKYRGSGGTVTTLGPA